MIFPSVTENALYEQSARQSIPWNEAIGIPLEAWRPSIPNRLLCWITASDNPDDQPEQVLLRAATAVQDRWRAIHQFVWEKLPKKVKDSSVWNKIWDRQTTGEVLELLYVWLQWSGENKDYAEAYQKTEALMGSRKAVRWFGEEKPEEGHKCSLCGVREALHVSEGTKRLVVYDGREVEEIGKAWRSLIREDWERQIRGNTKEKLRFKFREGETLCAVCTVKRLAPEFVFSKGTDTPSTSTVAVGAMVREILEAEKTGALRDEIDHFRIMVRKAAFVVGEPRESEPLPANRLPIARLDFDGDWLYSELYHKLEYEHGKDTSSRDRKKVQAAKDKLYHIGRAAAARDQLFKAHNANKNGKLSLPPCKYYCVLVADGDKMGQALGSVQTRESHEAVSAALARFSGKCAIDILQKEHLGYVVYFGGDEGLAFLVLEDLFKAMKALRKAWEDEVVPAFRSVRTDPVPTLSVGVVVAHHQDGLRGVIQSAHRAIYTAKEEIKGKDGFCVILDRRSGGTVSCRSKWSLDGLNVPVPVLLQEFLDAYRKSLLSPAWVNELRAEVRAIGDPPHSLMGNVRDARIQDAAELCGHEAARLIRRHREKRKRESETELEDQVEELADKVEELNNALKYKSPGVLNDHHFEDFINLMDLAQYVARGGGK